MSPVTVTFVSESGPSLTIRPKAHGLAASVPLPGATPPEVEAARPPATAAGRPVSTAPVEDLFEVSGMPDDGQALAGARHEAGRRARRRRARPASKARGRPQRRAR